MRLNWLVTCRLAFVLAIGIRIATPAMAREGDRYWVYLKVAGEAKADGRAAPALSPRAVLRMERAGRIPGGDRRDYALTESDLAPILERGLSIHRVSRFLQAASVWMSAEQAREIATDPRVRDVMPVGRFVRPLDPETATAPSPESGKRSDEPADTDPRSLTPADYGSAWDQLDMLGVPEMHARGYSGLGVLVAVFDTGFYKTHTSLTHLDKLTERDFVCGDDEVQYFTGDPCGIARANDHGTYTWSALGGFAPGKLLGPAYRATFALARTEDVTQEIHQEEDNYIAALEWADSLGVDIVSSSLGYRTFDDGSEYSVAELDGRTAPITIATDVAADRGILVVTAMGNEGPGASSLGAPADGRRVVAVGAIDQRGILASFSSWGPTGDGRIKPDVVALGVATYCAASSSPNVYARVGGTSLSTPLIAGLAALLVEAHPAWGPDSVSAALRASGDRHADPLNTLGWGVPDGLRASRIEDARLRLAASVWNDTSDGGNGNAIPSWGETGGLSVWVRNVGGMDAVSSRVWPAAHDARISLLDSVAVTLPSLGVGDSALVSLGRVQIGGGEGQDDLPVFIHFDLAGMESNQRLYLPVLPSNLVADFHAEADEAGAVRLTWRLASGAAMGQQLYRKYGSEPRTLLNAVPLPPDSPAWTDRPGTSGAFEYSLDVLLPGGFVSQEGPFVVTISEPTRALVGKPYPNPATKGTISIPLAWPRTDSPQVQIYAITGRRCVRTLIGDGGGGAYPILAWDTKDDDGRDVASGLYLARAPGGSTKRLLVVR
jgi:subtilisin family serine protease